MNRQDLQTLAAETTPVAAPPPPAEEVETGQVYGIIRDHDGNQVSGGVVWVFDRDERVATVPLESNHLQYSVELPADKEYNFMVDPSSLPGDLLPPLTESRVTGLLAQSLPKEHPDFFMKTRVEVVAGVQKRLDLQVSLPAKVSGRVLNPYGEPVSKVMVRLTRFDLPRGQMSEEDRSNFRGEFVIPKIYPGKYKVNIHPDPEFAPPEAGWNPPAMQDITILPGQVHDFGDIYLGNGRKTVVGLVVNQDGLPFPGLPVQCNSNLPSDDGLSTRYGQQITRVITDHEGRFELQHLDAIPISISITPDFYPGQAMGAGKPAMWEDLVKVDLSAGADVVDVGELVVQESRPFTISGDLDFDPAWLTQPDNKKSKLHIRISQVEGEQLPEGIRRNPIDNLRVPIDWEKSTYAYKVETPMTAVRITFSLQGYSDLRFVVRPEALQSRSRTIQIPGDFEALEH
ncbi:MAG: carboxypeptidase-like regulatory domain-containing protein [Planctomycetota bacterium]|nr:carboxypeptidase-like regulatory domain-containing protein [Planctomycetota bacterium]